MVCLQEAILFLQRLATLARSGYKGPAQQKWEATFLDMIHQLCTSTNLAQVAIPLQAVNAPPDRLLHHRCLSKMPFREFTAVPPWCIQHDD
jgi:hypothetical protein